MSINEPHPDIAKHFARWKRNRDVIEGADAIKCAGTTYLPRLPSQSPEEFEAYIRSVDFFPGAQRTLEGNIGLIFRKPATLNGGDGYEDILETITDTMNLDQLAREMVSERQTTAFTGLLVDTPAQPAGLSKAAAIAGGYRPKIAVYRAESILEVTPTVIANRRVVTKVRLLDDPETVRELRLDDGIYTVTIHHLVGGSWIAGETITPLKNGKSLTSVPFILDTSVPGSFRPHKAPLDDLIRMNLDHFRAQAQLNNVLRHIGCPMRYITGVENAEQAYTVSPDQIWQFTSKETKVGILEHSGAGVDRLMAYADTIKNDMAAVGSRILQNEKAAAEAAETLAIRRSSDNSILAALAHSAGGNLEAAVNLLMDWMGAEPITYSLNTDFLPTPLTAQELTALSAQVQAGLMSHETYFETLKAGEIYPEALTYEEEKARIDRDKADAPPVNAAPFNNDAGAAVR